MSDAKCKTISGYPLLWIPRMEKATLTDNQQSHSDLIYVYIHIYKYIYICIYLYMHISKVPFKSCY